MSTNPYDLLNNDEVHSKKPQRQEGPGKPDKSDQRRSVPREQRQQQEGGDQQGSNQNRPRYRVDDRQRRGRGGYGNAPHNYSYDGEGGNRGGRGRGAYRGGRGRGGRGGYINESDGVHRTFDRQDGIHHKHAPGTARKHGQNHGEAPPTDFAGSTEDFQQQNAAVIDEATDHVEEENAILEISPVAAEEESELTYAEFLEQQKARIPEEDLNRQIRQVSADNDNFKGRELKREDDDNKQDDKQQKSSKRKDKRTNKISLDEFVGERSPVSADTGAGGRGGYGGRGGRGGFDQRSPRGRGGRGGYERGGRGGYNRGPDVNINDASAFPKLG